MDVEERIPLCSYDPAENDWGWELKNNSDRNRKL